MLMEPPKISVALGGAGGGKRRGRDLDNGDGPKRPEIRYAVRYLPPGGTEVACRHGLASDPDDAVGFYLPTGCRLVSCKPAPRGE